MRIKKYNNGIVAVEGLGEQTKDVEIELVGAGAEDILRINGMVFHLNNGKRAVPFTAFREKNDIRVYTGSAWRILEGIERRENALVLSDEYIARTVSALLLSHEVLYEKTKALEEKVAQLEALCAGDDFI